MKNEVNRAGKAKKARYIVLGLVMSLALSVQARTYVAGEKTYVNVNQSFNWADANAKLFLYFFQSWSGGTQWMELTKEQGDVYVVTWNSDAMYDRVIVVRKSPSGTAGNWNDRWNQTCSIEIPDNGSDINYLEDFVHKTNVGDDCGDGYVASQTWKNYTPSVAKIAAAAATVTPEEMKICPSAIGDPLSLKAKLKADKSDYEYSNVKGHGWFKSTNGTSWVSMDTYAGNTRDGEGDINIVSTLEAGINYYYLHSNNPAGRRLIHIVQQTEGCDLNCEITSFETAISAVNADDNTYTLDGMVAFGKANGSLVIECDGKSETISSPQSPQSFSLHGVPAATENGKKTKAYAYFTGDGTCRDSIVVDVPNTKEAVEKMTRDSLTGKTITLTPNDYDPTNTYIWLADGDTIKGAPQVLVVDAFSKDTSVTYTYKEYYPASGTMDDMMTNGGYEEDNSDSKYGTYGATSTISDYDFWGYFDQTATTDINFYFNTTLNPALKTENGFAVVRNAHNFFTTFAAVTAKEGNNFALIDAKTGSEGGNKKAWYANTAKNPKLKLQKGTTYVLSFWAANINNYGEMDNAARFKFRIEYNSKKWESKELNLADAEFRNNIWHQCSQTFYAEEDCDNVTISVVNLNTNTLNVGNDFALDDIQFHAISSVSKVVKSQQQFVVTSHEPKVDAFTATVVPLGCDAAPNYTIKMHVEYQNPKGKLIIKDVTTGTEYPYTLPDVAFDTKANLDKDITITGLTPATHTWEAYFDEWTTAKISDVKTDAPVVPTIDTVKTAFSAPGCTDLYTTLTFDLDYTYQQGTLTYWVDAMTDAKQTATYNVAKAKADTLKGVTFANIPADGKNNHVLHVSFNGANSCIKDYTLPAVPFSPVITSVTVSGVPATVLCDETSYTATVSVAMPYDATGKNIVLTYEETSKTVAVSGNPTVTTLTLTTTDASGLTISAAYADSPTCTTPSNSYTAPTRLSCIKDPVTVCEGESYKWSVTGLTYGPFNTIGIDTIASSINIHDSLFVTVQPQPEITILNIDTLYDDITEIRVPYVVTKGTPNKFVCTIDGVVSTHAKTTVDTIVIAKPASVTTGDYTIDIEVIDSTFGTCHTTIQKKVHIAGIPSVSALTVTPREVVCGGSNYVIEVHAVYQNPRSALLVKDKTNGTTYTYVVPTVTTVPYNTPQTLDTVITIASMTPATLAWEALFTGWTGVNATSVAPTVPSMQINAVTPSAPACSKVSDVTFDVDYIYQQGQMQYKVDGLAAQTQAITPKNTGSLNTGKLTVSDVPADGKTHKLYVTFDGANSCQDSVTFTAPLSQVIDDVQITGVPATVLCTATDYPVTVDIVTPYDATGKNIVLSGAKDTTVVATGTKTTVSFNKQDINGAAQTITAAYAASPACNKSASYTPPAQLACNVYRDTICEGDNYTDNGFNIIAPPIGEAVHVNASKDTLYLLVADGHSMYSKWTDVLFIDNSDGSVVAYQWYENGALLPGETQQRLYNPAGLNGSYYCVLTKTDGTKISTCEKAFDKVTPSRTAGSAPGAAVIRKVRVSPHVYIIQESTGDEIRTRKILTPYE